MLQRFMVSLAALLMASALQAAGSPLPQAAPAPAGQLLLKPCRMIQNPEPTAAGAGGDKAVVIRSRCGRFLVPENRALAGTRMLALPVTILSARSSRPREPIFILAGGPGQPGTELLPHYHDTWRSQDHDIVLLDVRGTGDGNALNCTLGGSDADLQGYFNGFLADGTGYAACGDELRKRADLSQYTTMIAMRDLDELRQALGYRKINLEAGSFGTRAAITYIRMFPQHVHAALLFSVVPVENRAPLYHAAAAQRAFDLLVGQCRADAKCRAAYPDTAGDLKAVLDRLNVEPARVRVRSPATGDPTEVRLSASGMADALRVMLYSLENGRRVPLLLQRARAGDLTPFAEAGMQSSRWLTLAIRAGLLLSFTCAEDVARIRPDEVAKETAGSFIGAQRVHNQMAACSTWPKRAVPAAYYRPLRSRVPVILVSGDLDPVTPPMWGEIALRHFSRGIHMVIPGGHTPTNSCIDDLGRRLFLTGTTRNLKRDCTAATVIPAFELPDAVKVR